RPRKPAAGRAGISHSHGRAVVGQGDGPLEAPRSAREGRNGHVSLLRRRAPMTEPLDDLVERLAAHKPLDAIPREQLAWLAAHGTVRRLAEGDVLSAKGARVDGLHIVLDGRLAIYVDGGAGRYKVQEWGPGAVTGLLPFSRLVTSPVESIAKES